MGHLRGSGAGLAAWALVGATLALGCQKDFTGPYPCNEGFASCTPNNSCETSILDDPQNCGSCGNACSQGQICTNSICGGAPTVLATDLYRSALAINASTAFFPAITGGYTIEGVPKTGGNAFSVATPDAQQGSTSPFAVDDARLYYLAQNVSGSGPVIAASPAAPSSGPSPQPKVVGTFPTSGGNFGGLSAMSRLGGTLFLGANTVGQYVVGSVPTSGGMVVPIATFPGQPQVVAFDPTNVYAVLSSSGPCEIDAATVSGGVKSTLVGSDVLDGPNFGGCPQGLASDGTRLYWASNYSVSGNNDNGGNNPAGCAVAVTSVPIGGGPPMTLSTIRADEVPLQVAIDGASVYVATNKSLWRFSLAGDAPVRIAGNLSVAMTCGGSNFGSGGCSYVGGGCGGSSPLALALDDTSAYLALTNNVGTGQGGVLLKIAK